MQLSTDFSAAKKLSFLRAVFSYVLLVISITFAGDYIIPLDSLHWQKTYRGSWEATGDSIIFYGTSYRVGNQILSSQFFDMTDAEIFIKWKANGANDFMGIWIYTDYFHPKMFFTTDHSYNGSLFIMDDQWYYVHMKSINHGDSLLYTVSTGDYDINGGTILYQTQVEALKNRSTIKKADRIFLIFGDNYQGENCYFVLGEAVIKNTTEYTASYQDSTVFTFDDGQMPEEFFQDDFHLWSVAPESYDSSNCLFADVAPSDAPEIGFRVASPCKISFDEKFISNYDWNPARSFYVALDSVAIYVFDRSNFGDWFHYEFYIPDTNIHYIAFGITASGYLRNNAQAYLDNITVSGGNVLDILDQKDNTLISGLQLHQNYPNPFNPSTRIDYDLPFSGNVNISIYNLMGQKIATLVNATQTSGSYTVWFHANSSGKEIPAGIYFYRLELRSNNGKTFTRTRKMLLVK
jgi:hypothetical protein